MQSQLKTFLLLFICATCLGESSISSTDVCQDCDVAAGVSDQALLQAAQTDLVKTSEEAEEEEGEDEEETDILETDAPDVGGEESGGGHWDFLDEEHNDEPLEHPEEGEHLGGIKGIVSEAVSDLVAPLESQIEDVSAKIETMHEEMSAAHENDDTLEQVEAALDPMRSTLQSIVSKVDTAEQNHATLEENIQNVAEDLSKLDTINAAVGNAATADDVANARDAISGSVDAHEQNVAGALGTIYSKTRDNGKVLKKIYNDVHFGAAPAPAAL